MVVLENSYYDQSMKFKLSAVGGTFSLLHKGHETLLNLAFAISREVIIGITSDYYVNKHPKTHPIKDYEDRLKEVYRFLKENKLLGRSMLLPLVDELGPLRDMKDVQCVIVTTETYTRVKKVNSLRKKLGLDKLSIVILGLILAEDGKPISSTRIIRGEIDSTGKVVKSLTVNK